MMAKASRRAALYVRVNHHQSVENQIRELRLVAARRGWQVVEIYRDAGISGDKRPGPDAMLNDANRRKFDVVMAGIVRNFVYETSVKVDLGSSYRDRGIGGMVSQFAWLQQAVKPQGRVAACRRRGA